MKNKEHSDLIYEYNRIKGLYHHYLYSIMAARSSLTFTSDDPLYGYYPISDCKAEVGEYREMLNFYSKKLKELKSKIYKCQENYNKQNAVKKA